jgi:hypothetical protein
MPNVKIQMTNDGCAARDRLSRNRAIHRVLFLMTEILHLAFGFLHLTFILVSLDETSEFDGSLAACDCPGIRGEAS